MSDQLLIKAWSHKAWLRSFCENTTHRRDRIKRPVCDFLSRTSAYPPTTASRPCSTCVTVCERVSLPSSCAAGDKEKASQYETQSSVILLTSSAYYVIIKLQVL